MLGFASPLRLRRMGVVGMNRRNVRYIAPNNARSLYPLVDNKLKTKLLCDEHGIAVPRLLGVCRFQHHLRELDEFLHEHPSFVIKPAKGSGGKGIVVVSSRQGRNFQKPSGEQITIQSIKRHTSNTLSGLYSLGGKPDVAIIEEMVQFTDDFADFSFEGVPDVRVIVYRGYPVMAMMRLSTHASDGKANLHQGAVGVGIDLASGRALQGVQHGHLITHHPDTERRLSELVVPQWSDLLELAARSYEVTGLGYIGADIVIDRARGPLLLELNARPGLAIQMANGKGLEPRVGLAEQRANDYPDGRQESASDRVLYATESIAAL
ncbi:alpha-L-glutamate ligase-like protein [Halieaceae bacterium IMCC14734]|uniref:Alpha-L-glutamate ligase-like protein n=1 Tax=Candidatus Litorirhabdus singularis TaxID=2518993 RepID=A0ABT3TGF8_9GAMM|nr:alpha-L-glutamate ligase-like protein [Candidatus Litorirhabdus singularis]MCX2981398.1 alpha-L-glutamate ligase-like protein [Candidatus Litorirhabdus singularis]